MAGTRCINSWADTENDRRTILNRDGRVSAVGEFFDNSLMKKIGLTEKIRGVKHTDGSSVLVLSHGQPPREGSVWPTALEGTLSYLGILAIPFVLDKGNSSQRRQLSMGSPVFGATFELRTWLLGNGACCAARERIWLLVQAGTGDLETIGDGAVVRRSRPVSLGLGNCSRCGCNSVEGMR